ncbi:hypothetical protein CSA56_13610 [candidate division KSB3 bacterium]|uniref:J domain-containing protein n=1 Tax=candidate division KSB3 bacterium TaxID=2044937 RepID=A0A2G6KBB5_9BACT|nr:MAG: hypothetical protein CSA56_13610 [candidate division KSB3 bacterium]
MDEFSTRLRTIDREQLKHYLRSLPTPCYESQLFRVAFPDVEVTLAEPLSLYQHHFLLFHLLYQLQDEFYAEGEFLFVHFMRTIVRPYPDIGACRFFEENLTLFCRAACPPGKTYCDVHEAMVGQTALEELSVKYFYLDERNFEKLDAETAEAFLNGTWEIFAHYDTYQNSLRVLGLSETADLSLIKKTFKRLAKRHHPDLGGQSHETFIELNNAYQFLIRALPGMKKAFE